MIDIIPIRDVDAQAIERLLDEAFGSDRHGRTAYKLRAGMDAIGDLSFAAFEGEQLVGSIQCWPVQLTGSDGELLPLILLGPVAVHPNRQRDGIGRMLTDACLAIADATGSPPIVLIGDPEYYGRFFGFSATTTGGWTVPGPVERRRLLVRAGEGQTLPHVAALGPRIATPLVHGED